MSFSGCSFQLACGRCLTNNQGLLGVSSAIGVEEGLDEADGGIKWNRSKAETSLLQTSMLFCFKPSCQLWKRLSRNKDSIRKKEHGEKEKREKRQRERERERETSGKRPTNLVTNKLTNQPTEAVKMETSSQQGPKYVILRVYFLTHIHMTFRKHMPKVLQRCFSASVTAFLLSFFSLRPQRLFQELLYMWHDCPVRLSCNIIAKLSFPIRMLN